MPVSRHASAPRFSRGRFFLRNKGCETGGNIRRDLQMGKVSGITPAACLSCPDMASERKLTIAIFTDSYLPYCCGVTFAVQNQAAELAARGHEVWIFRPRPRRAQRVPLDLPDGVHVEDVRLSFPALGHLNLQLCLPTFLGTLMKFRRISPDVLHVNTEFGVGWEGLIIAKSMGIPVIGTFHTFFADPGYLKAIGLPTWTWLQKLAWSYSVFYFNRCNRRTSPSKAVRDALVERGSLSPPLIVSNGIQTPPIPESEVVESTMRELGARPNSFVYVGRISGEKSLEVLLDAIALVDDAQLILVGDGPARKELEAKVDADGISDRVIFAGMVQHGQLMAKGYPACGLAFVTASKTENQPMSILEAMAQGNPVIGVRALGIPGLVEDGVSGLLVEPDNVEQMAAAMRRLITEDGLQAKLAAGAREVAESNDLTRTVDQFEEVFGEAQSHAKRRSLMWLRARKRRAFQ